MAMEKTVRIINEEGFHARPAGVFVKKAAEFKSNIQVRANGMTKSAKSIMGLMSMGLEKDTELTIIADGEDAEKALESLVTLVNNKFTV